MLAAIATISSKTSGQVCLGAQVKLNPVAPGRICPRLAAVPRVPRPKTTVKQNPGRVLLEFCRDHRHDVLRFTTGTTTWPTNNLSERGTT